MEDEEIKLYLKLPWYYYFTILIPIMFFYFIIYYNSIFIKIIFIFGFVCFTFLLLNVFVGSWFKKIGFIINRKEIIFFNLFYKRHLLWDNIKCYNITSYNKNNMFLNFFTESYYKNNVFYKTKKVFSIPTKVYNININDLIERINELIK
jgi:hypothetical protein